MVVNESWRLAPWADAHYACDSRWWNNAKGWQEFKGIRITIDSNVAVSSKPDWNINLVQCDRASPTMILKRYGKIGWGKNSGHGAINIAAQFGVKNMILVGFDMSLSSGVHWHGPHTDKKMGNPRESQLRYWRNTINAAEPILTEAGIKVYDTFPHHGLSAFEKLSFEKALEKSLGSTAAMV
jgi:hypothetical protein